MKHTPGPWRFVQGDWNKEHDDIALHSAGSIVAPCDLPDSDWYIATMENAPEQEANARLIAAAPEVLEALKAIDAVIPIRSPHTIRVPHSIMAQIRNAITKAEEQT